jgi:ATP-dependent protease ClpP protease subunit
VLSLDRDTYMDANQALEFGVVDRIISKREVSAGYREAL